MDFRVKEQTTKDRVKKVEEQFRVWEVEGSRIRESREGGQVRFVTISREYGCAGFRIGDRLAAVLNTGHQASMTAAPWTVYDRELVDIVCKNHKLSRTLVETLDRQRKNVFSDYITGIFTGEPSSIKIFKKWAETIFKLASAGGVILVGRAAALITAKLPGGLHVRVIAPVEWRIEQVAAFEKIDLPAKARQRVLRMDSERERFALDFMGHGVSEPYHYHLILNQEKLGVDGIVDLILHAISVKRTYTGS